MKRELVFESLTTILPTFLITLVTFTSNFFGTEHFDAIVAVNVTAFLVIATLFISVSNDLPRTSYLKMIDLWMLFAMFVPFLIVVLQTRIRSLSKSSKITPNQPWKSHHPTKKFQILVCFSAYGLPLIYLLFVIGFFVHGLYL